MKDISYKRHSPRLVNPVRNNLVWLGLGVTGVIAVLTFFWLDALYSRSSQDVDNAIQARYRAEAKHIVESITTTIESMVPGDIGPELSEDQREAVKHIIRNAKFDGDKGYMYLYDIHGQCIAHGEQRDKEGENLLDLKDSDGVRFIEELLKAAKQGGGFVRYKWATREQPDTSGKPKIGFAQMLRGDTWWFGSGVYMEDIDRELSLMKAVQDDHIRWAKGIFLVVLILLMSGVFGVGRQMTRSLVENMITLADSVERERLALAGKLHNFVGGFVVRLNQRLTSMRSADDAETRVLFVNECMDSIRDFDAKCQQIENDIYPLDIRRHGVSEVLRAFLSSGEELGWRAGEGEQPSGLIITHDIQDVSRSTSRHELALYLVAQGLIHNVFKHAGASRCAVSLMYQEGAVIFTVSDDGRGFDLEAELEQCGAPKSRFGLRWIKAQVEVCEGSITMPSSVGSGATVCVTMPWPQVSKSGDPDRRTGL